MVQEQDPTFEICQEDKLLLLCARTNINAEYDAEINLLAQKDLDWGYLIQRAFQHRLIPLLYRNINLIAPNSIPPKILNILKDNFNENVKKNLLLLGELSKILKLFKSEDITAIPFKGPVLASLAYENIALRTFNDLDIVISSKDFLMAKNALISQGYLPKFHLSHLKELRYIKSQRELEFVNEDVEITVDLHWKFSTLSFSLPKTFDSLFDEKNAKVIKINNLNVLSPSNEDLLLILCLHNAGHRWKHLSLICDIAELIRSYNAINWLKLIEKANNLVIKRIVLINLYLANDLLELELPKEILHEINFDKSAKVMALQIEEKIFSKAENSTKLSEEFVITFKIRENKFYGLKDFIRGAVVPTAYEWEYLHLPLFLFPFYYILRPFHLLIRYNF